MISWYMLAMSDSTCYVQHLIVESVLLLSWGVLQPSFDGLLYLSSGESALQDVGTHGTTADKE